MSATTEDNRRAERLIEQIALKYDPDYRRQHEKRMTFQEAREIASEAISRGWIQKATQGDTGEGGRQ